MFFVLVSTTLGLAAPALAQEDMSVEEIRNAFQRQVMAFKNVKTRGLGGTSQDRGLKLITVEDIKTDEKGEQIVVASQPPGASGASGASGEAAATTGRVASVQTGAALPDASAAATSDGKQASPPATSDAGTATASASAASSTGATITASTTVQSGDTATGSQGTGSQATGSQGQVIAASAGGTIGKPLVYGKFRPELQVNLHIEFGFDSAALDPSQTPKLQKMCVVLQTTPIHKIRIVGHTDASGTEEYNERLSILRAREVARHLTQKCGIDPARLETVGLGERFPFNANDPEAQENRRVEFQALS